MKQHTTAKKNQKVLSKANVQKLRDTANQQRLTIGLDLGDRYSSYCILGEGEAVLSEGQLPTTTAGVSSLFEKMPASRVALEVGTHSPWVSRKIGSLGHEVIVANPHKVRLITHAVKKNDRVDAEKLARLARVDPQLLSPIRHRGEEAQADLAVIRARADVVEARTMLINSARGLVKPLGERLKSCDADQVGEELGTALSEKARRVIGPLLNSVKALSGQIGEYDKKLEEIAERYPEIQLLTQVYGVGTVTGLTYLLTLEDTGRFAHSRDVGAFVGLQPRQRESGDRQPELGISKGGDRLLRSYLVQAAHCILRKGAPDSDLQGWGKKIAGSSQGGKRRALIAIARKLAVLLHRLWSTGEVYDPLYQRKAEAVKAAKKTGAQAGAKAAGPKTAKKVVKKIVKKVA